MFGIGYQISKKSFITGAIADSVIMFLDTMKGYFLFDITERAMVVPVITPATLSPMS